MRTKEEYCVVEWVGKYRLGLHLKNFNFFFIFLNPLVSQNITWEKQRNEIVLALGVGFRFSHNGLWKFQHRAMQLCSLCSSLFHKIHGTQREHICDPLIVPASDKEVFSLIRGQ